MILNIPNDKLIGLIISALIALGSWLYILDNKADDNTSNLEKHVRETNGRLGYHEDIDNQRYKALLETDKEIKGRLYYHETLMMNSRNGNANK